jgi:hypothetical protein
MKDQLYRSAKTNFRFQFIFKKKKKLEGGNVQLINMKPNWNKVARTEHSWGGKYRPSGKKIEYVFLEKK